MVADFTYDFFVLAGDADHNRHVDAFDQATLNGHLNQSGDFSAGDFNYDGTVNGADTAILTNNLNVWLPPQGALALPYGPDGISRLSGETSPFIDYDWTDPAFSPVHDRIAYGAVTSFSLTTGPEADTLTIDYSTGAPLPAFGIGFDGGGGNNTLSLIGPAGVHSFVVNSTGSSPPGALISIDFGSAGIGYVNTQNVIFDPATGNDSLDITGTTVSLPVPLSTASSTAKTFSNLNVEAGGALIVPTRFNGGLFDHSHRTSITVSTLFIAPAATLPQGTLDLGDNDLNVIASTSPIRALLRNGQLFTSTTGGVLGYTDVGGQTDVRFTILGDTNLDGHVDVTDLGNLASNYGKSHGAVWVQGDSNYDGAVDVSDLGNLASNYGASIAAGPAAALTDAARPTATTFNARLTAPEPAVPGTSFAATATAATTTVWFDESAASSADVRRWRLKLLA